jgi:DNA (cytosine-5)-methyltransferase 1
MLTVDEIRAGMAFTPGYTLLGRAKRAKVRMLGNAVTPPAARDLMAAVAEAITSAPIEPAA